jgi:adenine-specific DNA-methyltransferase
MIKYIGSKRRLVPVLDAIASRSGAHTALDLFTGTTRVAQAFKRRGIHVTAVDSARYAHVFAQCYVQTDAGEVTRVELDEVARALDSLPGSPGYVTETFCRRARFFQPMNGERIDAIRDEIAGSFAGSALEPLLLTALIEAADRVDSTIGVQMAYVKQWAERSFHRLELRSPELLEGPGQAVRGDARALAPALGRFDIAYLDPPYNQHRYFTNYHVWETLVAWDAPEHYGIACKRVDARDPATKSEFNSKRTMPVALAETVAHIDCGLLLLSYNDESWVSTEQLERMCAHHDEVLTLAFDSARYVGARLGIHNPQGVKVGTVSHLRNREYLVLAGERDAVREAVAAARAVSPGARTAARSEVPTRRSPP